MYHYIIIIIIIKVIKYLDTHVNNEVINTPQMGGSK